jgi:hypothetical protein
VNIAGIIGSSCGSKVSKPLILKDWLGGLDSNQDSQSQSLESYQLDDLPAVANKVVTVLDGLVIVRFSLNFHHYNQAFNLCLPQLPSPRLRVEDVVSVNTLRVLRSENLIFRRRQLLYCRPA